MTPTEQGLVSSMTPVGCRVNYVDAQSGVVWFEHTEQSDGEEKANEEVPFVASSVCWESRATDVFHETKRIPESRLDQEETPKRTNSVSLHQYLLELDGTSENIVKDALTNSFESMQSVRKRWIERGVDQYAVHNVTVLAARAPDCLR